MADNSRRRWIIISVILFTLSASLTVIMPWIWAIVGITPEVGVATAITVGVLVICGLLAAFRADTVAGARE